MATLGQKFQEAEAKRVRLLQENTSLLRSVSRLERERDTARLEADASKIKLEAAEGNLSQALAEIDSTKKGAYEEGYQKGFDTATTDYVEQMPGIQDQIWVASWEACLTKVRAPDNSVLWVENDLPSRRTATTQEQEETPDDVEQIIDDFTDADGGDQIEGQNVQDEHPSAEDDTVNLEEQAIVGDPNIEATTDIPSETLPEIQNLD